MGRRGADREALALGRGDHRLAQRRRARGRPLGRSSQGLVAISSTALNSSGFTWPSSSAGHRREQLLDRLRKAPAVGVEDHQLLLDPDRELGPCEFVLEQECEPILSALSPDRTNRPEKYQKPWKSAPPPSRSPSSPPSHPASAPACTGCCSSSGPARARCCCCRSTRESSTARATSSPTPPRRTPSTSSGSPPRPATRRSPARSGSPRSTTPTTPARCRCCSRSTARPTSRRPTRRSRPRNASVEDAVRLGADAVGYTLYVGSPRQDRDLAQLKRCARTATATACRWSSGPTRAARRSRRRAARTRFYAIDYAARMAMEMGADVVKLNLPSPDAACGLPRAVRRDRRLPGGGGPQVVASAGRSLVVLSGGSKIDDDKLLEQTRYIMEARRLRA